MASKEIIYKEQTFKLAYELVNPTQDEVLLVLHGWGSNKEIMKQAFENVFATSLKYDVNMRIAAYITAIDKVASTKKLRGIF